MPTRHSSAIAMAITMAILAMSSCTSNIVGTAIPQQPTATSTAQQASQRPQTIKMNEVDPCTLLTEEQRAEFLIDWPASPGDNPTFKSKECYFSSMSFRTGLVLLPVTSRGVETFAPGKINGESRAVTVRGFHAYENWTPQNPGWQFCTVNVDVADGQVLRTHVTETARKENPLGRQEICRRAARAAELALTNLMAK